jgi:hypothetical protein
MGHSVTFLMLAYTEEGPDWEASVPITQTFILSVLGTPKVPPQAFWDGRLITAATDTLTCHRTLAVISPMAPGP